MFWLIFICLILLFTYLGKDNFTTSNKYIIFGGRLGLSVVLSYVVAYSAHNYVDNEVYIAFYESLRNENLSFGEFNLNIFSERLYMFEPGFRLLSIIIYRFGLGNIGYLFIIALLTNILFVNLIYRFKYPIFIIISFVTSGLYFQECNLVRQMLAVAIFCYSLRFIKENKKINYILCIVCASLFHTSAIILLVFLIITWLDTEQSYSKYNKYLFVIWCLSIIISFGVASVDISRISFLNYYQGYLSTENNVGVGSLRMYSLMYNLCIFLYYYLTDKYKVREDYVYIIVFILGGVLTNISIVIPNLYRFSLYFTMLQIVIVPSIIKSNVRMKYNNLSNISFLLLFVYYLSRIFIRIFTNDNPFL